MNQTDNTLRTQVLLLSMKALDVISKALDIISTADTAASPAASPAVSAADNAVGDDAAITAPAPSAAPASPAPSAPASPAPSSVGAVGGFAADTASPAEAPSAPSSPKPSKPSSLDTYRADAIRFNEQFLRDHYDLRYNTMKKTTEFRPKSAVPSDGVITPLPSWGGAGGEASPLPPTEGVGGGAWLPVTDGSPEPDDLHRHRETVGCRRPAPAGHAQPPPADCRAVWAYR